jgi:hypothetical protein
VTHEVCIIVISRDRSLQIDAGGKGADHAGDGAWGIEGGEGAVARPEEAVTHEVYVIVVSGDRTQQIDAGGIGAVDLTRGIKGGEEA